MAKPFHAQKYELPCFILMVELATSLVEFDSKFTFLLKKNLFFFNFLSIKSGHEDWLIA